MQSVCLILLFDDILKEMDIALGLILRSQIQNPC